MRQDPIHRRYHHDQLTFRMLYAFSENFVLPLSHDEVVHGKGSLLGRCPATSGSDSPTCGCCCGYMFAQPGKKLLFMGGEFGQWREWDHDGAWTGTCWTSRAHQGLQHWVRDLNRVYRGCRPCTASTASRRASSGSIAATVSRA